MAAQEDDCGGSGGLPLRADFDFDFSAMFKSIQIGRDSGLNVDPKNKRLHIQFNHGGCVAHLWGKDVKKQVEDKILGSIWAAFGQVSNVYYHSEYAFCFLSFPSHEAAKRALASINNETKVSTAIDRIIEAQTDPKAKEFVTTTTQRLFVKRGRASPSCTSLLRASWAQPRSRRECGYHDHGYDSLDNDNVDDCPDGFDRKEWNSYCEGRD